MSFTLQFHARRTINDMIFLVFENFFVFWQKRISVLFVRTFVFLTFKFQISKLRALVSIHPNCLQVAKLHRGEEHAICNLYNETYVVHR